MDRAEFNSDMRKRGMKQCTVGFTGVVDGMPVTVSWINKRNVSMVLAMDQGTWKQSSRQLKSELKTMDASAGHDGKKLTVAMRTDKLDDVYEEGFRQAVRMLRGMGIRVPDVCGLCGKGGCNAAALISGCASPIHTDCLENLIEDAQLKASRINVEGNYATGLIGAFLGMLVGTIPSFLTIIVAERIYALLFAFMPLGAYYGYSLFKGRMNKMAAAASIIMGILGVYVLEYGLAAYQLVAEEGYTVGESLTIIGALMTVPEVWLEITKGSIMEIIFVGLGILYVWSVITKNAATEKNTVESVRSTCVPYTGSGSLTGGVPDKAENP